MSTNPPNNTPAAAPFSARLSRSRPNPVRLPAMPIPRPSARPLRRASNPPVGKHAGEDENNPIDQTQVESLQQGAAAQSAAAQQASGDPAGGAPAEDSATGDQAGPRRIYVGFDSQLPRRALPVRERPARPSRSGGRRSIRAAAQVAVGARRGDHRQRERHQGQRRSSRAERFLADSTMRRGVDTSEPKPGEPR
jgi:hypothetical protein